MLNEVENRQQEIVNYLKQPICKSHRFDRVSKLAKPRLNVTLFSGKSGLIRRVRGGAMLIDNRKLTCLT